MLPLYAMLAVLYLALPVLVMIAFSFNDPTGRANLTWKGFSIDAWLNPLGRPGLAEAVFNSLVIAMPVDPHRDHHRRAHGARPGASLVPGPGRRRTCSCSCPCPRPEIVLGTSLLTLFIASDPVGVRPQGRRVPAGHVTRILIAHVMFNISFVVVTVRARLLGFPSHLEEAARDLYADDWTTFWRVTFPLILPGVIAAALLAFSLSIDDYVITAFTAGPTTTFPLYIYGAQQRGIPVQVNVIGTIIFVTAVGFVLLTTVLSRRQRTDPVEAATIGEGDHDHHPCRRRHRWRSCRSPRPTDRSCPRSGRATRTSSSTAARGRGWSRPTASATSTTPRASASPTPATPIPRVSAAVAAQAVKLLHGQQNIVYHEPGLRLHAQLADLAPGAGLGRVPVQQRRGGGRGRGQAGARRDGPAGHRRLPGRLPRPHGPGDGADHVPGHHPRRLRAAARVRLPRALPGSAIAGGGDGDALRADWERAMTALFAQLVDPRRVAAFVIEPVMGEGGYIVPPAWFLPRLRELADASTASCSSRTRSRPASGGPGGSGPSSTGTSRRTSS